MVVGIDKIIVGDRIRKEFGEIKELAEDIRENGLINPPVVNKNYELLAGERRLRACKSLGWSQIEVRMVDTRDAEHELNIEISENEVRKDFSKAERIDYAKRLERIEEIKASKRKTASLKQNSTDVENFPPREELGKTRDIVADKLGIGSGRQYEKEKFIVENQFSLAPEDFADWDEGKLSTNKAFQKIKAELAAKERQIKEMDPAPLRREIDRLKGEIANAQKSADKKASSALSSLQAEKAELERRLSMLESQDGKLQSELAAKDAYIKDQDRTIEHQKSRIKALECEYPAFQEANQCTALWASTQRFVSEVLDPFRDGDMAQKNREGLPAELIKKSCDLLASAVDAIERRLYEEADIIDMY